MNDRVTVEIRDRVADVRLVRAAKMNALDADMFAALLGAGERIAADGSVRAVVLSGEGKAFCAGLDMRSFERMGDGSQRDGVLATPLPVRTHGDANAAQRIATIWRDLPVPVIAAVHGVAFGGGLQLALGADIRIVSPEVRMSVMEIKWGLVPDMAGILLMRELARPDVVKELTWSGRQFGGEEAVRIGFATALADDPYRTAHDMARGFAARSPDALRAAKRLMALPLHDRAAILLAESVEQERLLGSPNQLEAVQANLAGRDPRFADAASRS